jgi:crossover junction endodeoxyribonuclease RusA
MVTTTAPTTFRLLHRARPWTANAERRMHPMARAKVVREWRTAFTVLAREAKIPRLDRIVVTAMPIRADRRWRPDVAACYGAVKAAIDGLVDAGVLLNDGPDHVAELTFAAPSMGAHDALMLVVEVVA